MDPIEAFLAGYAPEIEAISRALRALTCAVTTDATEILLAGENHIAYCLGPSASLGHLYLPDAAVCVRLGFDYGGFLEDPGGLLQGAGKRMRHVKAATRLRPAP